MSKTWKLLVALLVASGLLVACGGDDDDGADAAAEIDADADADIDADDVAEFAMDSEQCLEASTAFLSAAGGAAALFGGAGDELEESLAAVEDFRDEVPEEIREDFEIFVDVYAELSEAFADMDFDPQSGEAPNEEQMALLEEMGERFEDSELQEATENIQAWFEENCSVDADG